MQSVDDNFKWKRSPGSWRHHIIRAVVDHELAVMKSGKSDFISHAKLLGIANRAKPIAPAEAASTKWQDLKSLGCQPGEQKNGTLDKGSGVRMRI
jgi:hypothetical protein